MADITKRRLDQLLVERGAFASRARARDAVARGCVRVDGKPIAKPGAAVAPDASIAVDDDAQRYVARSALKLVAGLDAFAVDPMGWHALDVGQSTGGFTQILLERGATHVTGVDVGHDQLHPDIAADRRVTVLEGINARDTSALPMGPFDLAVVDVSFISLQLVLPAVLPRLAASGTAIALFKPQFEVGRAAIGKGGRVTSEAAEEQALSELLDRLSRLGWRVAASIRSPLPGGDGTVERLLHLVRTPG
ncbi:MAG: TlyA family RNA methyltransferase [Devosiaceae bacterium]|nr:TlyA family RNA methyltransferase [Devosiaceae bacterium MH13]